MISLVGERLGVFLNAEEVGELERRGPSRYRFTYSPATVRARAATGVFLSASLPLRSQSFAPAESSPFFEGLLPEGAVRSAIARSFHISEEDGFGLLRALGADCAGAVAVLPPDHALPALGGGSLRSLSDRQLGQLIDDLLVFSRMGRQEMLHGTVNLNQLIASVLHDLRHDLQDRAISWTIAQLPEVTGDAAMLRQVLPILSATPSSSPAPDLRPTLRSAVDRVVRKKQWCLYAITG